MPKVFPGTFDRDFQCRVFPRAGSALCNTRHERVEIAIDEAELDNIVNGLDFSARGWHRQTERDGTYGFVTSARMQENPTRPWSSSKVYAGHHAANKLRGGYTVSWPVHV